LIKECVAGTRNRDATADPNAPPSPDIASTVPMEIDDSCRACASAMKTIISAWQISVVLADNATAARANL